ncbi:hypothetical protein [Streptomyces halstedii]|uniref:hypothetical protein n=1 Tax=Streptomyces halstedii TaxID=1944 RepID=UPI0033621361
MTTDSVSIYQFRTLAGAKRYAAAMGDVGPAEQVGPFVVSWAGRRGADLPAKPVRAKLLRDVRALVKAG